MSRKNLILLIGFICYFKLVSMHTLNFYEEPSDAYLTKHSPAILTCKIENARTIFFKCNDQWSQEPSNSKFIQIGNKQILSIDLAITQSQLDDYKKNLISGDSYLIPEFWCTCQGWLNSADDTIISRKAYVKLAYLEVNFDWEPMPTTGLIGKSVEIRCLPPEGDPKPNIYWLKNNQLVEKTNKRVIISHEGSLLINEVRISDAANYTCVAENIAGKRLSESAQLTVTTNKGWSDWSNWTTCESLSLIKCGEGTQKRYRTCLNPPTINNAIGCDGFPHQTITCYVPCVANSNKNMMSESLNIISHSDSKISNVKHAGSGSSLESYEQNEREHKEERPGYWWSQWSSWSMICNSECQRPRKRECKKGYLSANGKLVPLLEDSEEVPKKTKMCAGKEIEYGNCTFYCEPVTKAATVEEITTTKASRTHKHIIMPIFTFVIVFSVLLLFICRRLCNRKKKKNPPTPLIRTDPNHPIYYSVQPEYPHDAYMDVHTLLTNKNNNQHHPNGYFKANLNINTQYNHNNCDEMEYLNEKGCQNTTMITRPLNGQLLIRNNANGCIGTCSASSGSSEHCDASRNSTSTTTSGTNSTASSKIKLTASPTDSLVKNACLTGLPLNCVCCTNNKNLELDNNYENNAFQIMQLINERKSCVYQAKQIKSSINEFEYDYDLYQFNLFKSGGIIEIPKYSTHILIPDEINMTEINLGLCRANNENVLSLKGDQSMLSSVILVKTNYQTQHYPKPIIISIDHSAQSSETHWETNIFFKSVNNTYFEEINEQLDTNLYSQVVGNRCFIMTERDGMYALVGRPIINGSTIVVKEMKYAIILVNGAIKLFITQNTRAHTEILNDEIQKSNGKIIKMPELFELTYPKKNKLENSFLNLELNVIYNNSIINSDSTCRQIRMADVWNSSSDFIEIEIPVTINNNICKQQFNQSLNYKLANQVHSHPNRNNFDLKVSLEFEGKCIFSYSNLNANTHELHTANCNQQEFYSSVSVNPVYIPLQVTGLLDDYMLKCFKMNTLKKNNWKLFANLLKCDRNVEYFSSKDNSFELILSLWLMINISRSDKDNLTINFTES